MKVAIWVAAALAIGLPRTASADEVANGLQLGVDLIDRTIPLSGEVNFSTPIHAGYHYKSWSFLLGLYLARGSISDVQTGDFPHDFSTNALWFEVAPSARYHLRPLEAGSLSPFVQAEFDWIIVARGGSDQYQGNAPKVFGFAAGGGAEYLISKNFGIAAAASFRFLYGTLTNPASGTTGNVTTRVTALALGGTAGIDLHF